MRKRKNGERNYRKFALRIITGFILLIIIATFMPTLYRVVTYYQLPEDYSEKILPDRFSVNSFSPYKLCAELAITGGYDWIIPSLTVRMVIDGEIVPWSEVYIVDVDNLVFWDGITPPLTDMACTTEPTLAIGEHEIVVFTSNSYLYSWYAQSRWIVRVDEAGMIR